MEMNSIQWSPVLRYATPHPHSFDCSAPTQVHFVRFAVRHTPPDQQDPHFDRRRSVLSVLRYATPLSINKTPVSNMAGRTQDRFLRSAVR